MTGIGERGLRLAITIIATAGSSAVGASDELGTKAFAVPAIVSAADVPDPRKLPNEALRRTEVKMAVCPGQVGLGSLCVYAGDRPLRDVTLRISDLVAEEERSRPDHGWVSWQLPAQ